MTWAYVLAGSAIGTAGAAIGAGLALAFPRLHGRLRSPMLGYAAGTLLGAAFLGLLPEAADALGVRPVLAIALGGFVGFFVLEKALRLPRVQGHAGERAALGPAGTLVLLGDTFHNFVDGVVIGAAFASSVPLGLVAALAVAAHEIPQELGEFAVLLQGGWPPWRAFWANMLSAAATVPGALVAYAAIDAVGPHVPVLLALAAASFLYVATVDLAPLLHHEGDVRAALAQVAAMLLGIGTLAALAG